MEDFMLLFTGSKVLVFLSIYFRVLILSMHKFGLFGKAEHELSEQIKGDLAMSEHFLFGSSLKG